MKHNRQTPLVSRVALVPIALALALSSCGSDTATSTTGDATSRITVVATTTQLQDFVRMIGGDKVKLVGLLKPNVDPHDFEPGPAEQKALSDARVIVKNGVGLDKWLDAAVTAADTTATIVDASSDVAIRQGTGDEVAGDPHIWHNPMNAKIMVENITKALVAADDANTAIYRANQTTYSAQLDTLDADISAQIGTLANKKLVTNHDAFGYFVDRYGLTFVGAVIPSFDTSAEPSAADVTDLVAQIKDAGVKAIFAESSLPPSLTETIGRDAGVRVIEGDESLYGDTLGPVGSSGATYLLMMRHNTSTIVNALK